MPTKARLADARDTLQKQLRQVDRALGPTSDAIRKRKQRAIDKVIEIPQCLNRMRRDRLEQDDVAWLMHYFGAGCGIDDPFTYEFTEHQLVMIHAIGRAIRQGGDQAIAAPRGEGKTTFFERMILKYTSSGVINYAVLCAATGTLADCSLDTIKTAYSENDYLLADYPEICHPVRALENAPQRAGGQLVNGERHDTGERYEMAASKFTWSGQEIILPNVPGAPGARAIIATRGLESAVRGLKKRGKRPQIVGIDDPDTEDTSRSEEQARKLETRIDRALGGLGSQKKPVSRVMLTTLQSRTSVSFKFTDPKQKPTFSGKRFRFLVKPPDRLDKWDEYCQIRNAELEAGDKEGRGSCKFYAEQRKAMDAGAVLGNVNRFDETITSDGTTQELSALQHYFNEVARIGAEAVATELDNDPPEEDAPTDSGLTAKMVSDKLSGYPQGVVPPECTVITRGVDVQKSGLYWVVKAWREDATNYVIDYGFQETHGTKQGSDEGLEIALKRAIATLLERAGSSDIKNTLIDSGWQTNTVYTACREYGKGVYPAKGCGGSRGCAVRQFRQYKKGKHAKLPGDRWQMSRQDSKAVWLINCDADYWKNFEHQRWLTAEGQAGAAYIFGQLTDQDRKNIRFRQPAVSKDHFSFARHITAESEVEEMTRGVLKRYWKPKPGRAQNHYLDASYLADVAASMMGIRLLQDSEATKAVGERKPRKTLGQMAGAA